MSKSAPEIRVKRIYDTPAPNDGMRVLVDRLWPRGISKEKAALTLWLKEISPSPELRKWFGHDPERYPEFARRYESELAHNSDTLARLAGLAKQGPLTLLYAARDQAHNEAVVLAAYLHQYLKDSGGNDPA